MGGLFGIVSKDDCTQTLFYGTDYHSHLGTENAGLAVYGDSGFVNVIHSISQSQFKSRFVDDLRRLAGTMGLGAIEDESPQPLIIRSRLGTFGIVTSGLVTNKELLIGELLNGGDSFNEMASGGVNTTEMIGKLVGLGKDLVDGIERMQERIEGSICLLIMTEEGIYAARDRYGRFPLALGRKKGGDGRSFVVATEASSFTNLGYELDRQLGPGEIVLLNSSGINCLLPPRKEKKVCAFLWIYTGYPSSSYEGIGVEVTRERCGRNLARGDNVTADYVTGIPDSGISHALGYAMESGLPYRRPLVKYTPGYGRSYTPPSQEIRNLVATMKLSAVRDVIAGNRIVVCEDSIVRGTQLKNYTVRKFWENGAKEIHVRVACPPLLFPCIYGSSTRSTKELAARVAIEKLEGNKPAEIESYLDHNSAEFERMVEVIRKEINVTTLKYMTIEDMISAIGLPEQDLCLYCWRGR